MPFGKTKKLVHLKIFFRIVDSYYEADILVCNNLVSAVAPENGPTPRNKEFPMYNESALRALKRRALLSTKKDLPQLLNDYGGDPQALSAIQKSVEENFQAYKRWETADSVPNGYWEAQAKVDLVDAFQLSAARKSPALAVTPEEEISVAKTLALINQRLAKLEAQMNGQKNTLK